MRKKLIKICDIKNIYETRTLGKYQVNYVGYHLISKNDFCRYDQIKQCIRELKMYYPKTKSILVTKEQDFAVLKKIINEIEFDGIQLHFPINKTHLIKAIRGEFGKNFLIIQVLIKQTVEGVVNDANFNILDNSYLGGTGKKIKFNEIESLANRGKINNSLVAGGISSETIDKYLDLNIKGFDVQSSVKKIPGSSTENTDFNKVEELVQKLGFARTDNNGQIGFSIQDVFQNNSELLQDALVANIDFLHIDVSDGFIGNKTDIKKTLLLVNKIKKTNSHIPIQFHFYCQTLNSFSSYFTALVGSKHVDNLSFFAHINRDNDKKMRKALSKNLPNLFFSLDVKDIIDDTYPWEKYIKDRCILCVQSKKHNDRVFNVNRSIKLLKYSAPSLKSVTIDRGIEPRIIYELEDKSMISLVSGSYLSSDLSTKYKLLKEMLYE